MTTNDDVLTWFAVFRGRASPGIETETWQALRGRNRGLGYWL